MGKALKAPTGAEEFHNLKFQSERKNYKSFIISVNQTVLIYKENL